MKSVSVYRVDYVRQSKVRVGTVIERRSRERGDNRTGLLHLARKLFAATPQEAFSTTLGGQASRPA
jgi:hypothetical protein